MNNLKMYSGVAIFMAIALVATAGAFSTSLHGVKPSVSNVTVNFTEHGVPSSSVAILKVDGKSYKTSQLPKSFSFAVGTEVNYTYVSSLNVSNHTYTFKSISGCGLTKRTGTFVANESCTVNATYVK